MKLSRRSGRGGVGRHAPAPCTPIHPCRDAGTTLAGRWDAAFAVVSAGPATAFARPVPRSRRLRWLRPAPRRHGVQQGGEHPRNHHTRASFGKGRAAPAGSPSAPWHSVCFAFIWPNSPAPGVPGVPTPTTPTHAPMLARTPPPPPPSTVPAASRSGTLLLVCVPRSGCTAGLRDHRAAAPQHRSVTRSRAGTAGTAWPGPVQRQDRPASKRPL